MANSTSNDDIDLDVDAKTALDWNRLRVTGFRIPSVTSVRLHCTGYVNKIVVTDLNSPSRFALVIDVSKKSPQPFKHNVAADESEHPFYAMVDRNPPFYGHAHFRRDGVVRCDSDEFLPFWMEISN